MKVSHVSCGPPANESEIIAFKKLNDVISAQQGTGEWVLLSNFPFSINNKFQSEEIDIVSIGSSDIRVIEVKHWNLKWVNENEDTVKIEVERLTKKAKKIGTTLKKKFANIPYVEGCFLLTGEFTDSDSANLAKRKFWGTSIYTLKNCADAVGLSKENILEPNQINNISRVLYPKASIALDGDIRRFANYSNLELHSPKGERFHRVYKGIGSLTGDKIILHIYDLSATTEKNAQTKAEREFKALHKLQGYNSVPRILDSFQEASGYPGEMFFYSLVDPTAPNLVTRSQDKSWSIQNRISFARKAFSSLKDLSTIHRNLTPETILVLHENNPMFTGFDYARIPTDVSISSMIITPKVWEKTAAPEIIRGGLPAATYESDIYSLCASLKTIFEDSDDEKALETIDILQNGMTENPQERFSFDQFEEAFKELLEESLTPPTVPSAKYWSEDQVIHFHDHDYKIVTKLGAGGVGATFKVVQIDKNYNESGTFVAKVVNNDDFGKEVIKSYSLVRSYLGNDPGLSAVFEVSKDWRDNNFVALMKWIEGVPLANYIKVFPLLADEYQEGDVESLAIKWIKGLCHSLGHLHSNNLTHGDVSLKNIIESNGCLVLTDYDFVTPLEKSPISPGTMLYCSPSRQRKEPALPADDLYALAAAFFHLIFEREPFPDGDLNLKIKGLDWGDIQSDQYPLLKEFFGKALCKDPSQRFMDANEVIEFLKTRPVDDPTLIQIKPPVPDPTGIVKSEENIEWLMQLMQSYPGSRWGNSETRGLDTDFAEKTYVETGLEDSIVNAIQNRNVRLVLLCGNAGDGKTALLQTIASKLGFVKYKSSERVIEHTLEDGLVVRINFDGSASWKGKSADEILDKFLAPFYQLEPENDIAHLLAINDGRLLEWVEEADLRTGESIPLTDELDNLLRSEENSGSNKILFLNLNKRSLVGGITSDKKTIETRFLDNLLYHLYGGENATKIWEPCLKCRANVKCEVYRAMKLFGPDSLPVIDASEVRNRAKDRLFEAMQAVHLRGEVHITTRELRAALSYILFGLYHCTDYHSDPALKPDAYWDLAFSPTVTGRQGELLHELTLFDPALDVHPKIDRYLQCEDCVNDIRNAPKYDLPIESARRRAYFEWTADDLNEIANDENALKLARVQHLNEFKMLPLENGEMNDHRRNDICEKLCDGIARLENLPQLSYERKGLIPLRITPRTPTETSFWIEKPLNSFRMEIDLPPEMEGMDRLHRQIFLIYRYSNGFEERLRLGAELFNLLLELSEGYQLGDISSDDIYTQLAIFVQRLVREDEHRLMAWNPISDEKVFLVSSVLDDQSETVVQKLTLHEMKEGGKL